MEMDERYFHTEFYFYGNNLSVCNDCGSVVLYKDIHDELHDKLGRTQRLASTLNRIR